MENPIEKNRIDESRILYQSGQCLVINKLPGEAVEGAGPGMIDLGALLAGQFGPLESGAEPFFPAPVHRLDVPVSGCALFARTPLSLSSLNAAFAARTVQKIYWAVIEKPPPEVQLAESGELVHWIAWDPKRNKSSAHDAAGPGRKEGRLRYTIKGEGTHYLFLEIDLLTGRRHQIRAQLAALDLHVKGDLKYGSRRSEKNGGIRLHARSLSFPDPLSKESVRITAPPPVTDRLWQDFESCK